MEQKVSKLEVDMRVCQLQIEEMKKNHREEIKEMKDAINVLNTGFTDITKLISSIKWWVIGAVSIMTLSELGLTKMIFKVLAFTP
jgi:hypothetical protein